MKSDKHSIRSTGSFAHHKSWCRNFIQLIEETRTKSYKWTPAETMCHILAESGYLAAYEVSCCKITSHAFQLLQNPVA